MAKDQEVVERFQDSSQAVMLRDILKGNGFNATIHGQSGMTGSGARMAGGFLVTVPKSEMHEVKNYLKRLEKEAWLHNEDDEEAAHAKGGKKKGKKPGEKPADKPALIDATDPNYVPEKCPHCGSKNIHEMITPAPLRFAMTVLLLGLPLLFPKPRTWMCKDCEQHWP